MTAFLIATLIFGVLLVVFGDRSRQRAGLGRGRTVALDDRTLFSRRLRLSGRPDRILAGDIPEEWKSARRVYDSHVAQLATYFLLIEEETGVRPPHGFIVLGNGERVEILNTPELRAWALDIADRIRAAKREIDKPIPVNQPPAKCRGCGMREACAQRTG